MRCTLVAQGRTSPQAGGRPVCSSCPNSFPTAAPSSSVLLPVVGPRFVLMTGADWVLALTPSTSSPAATDIFRATHCLGRFSNLPHPRICFSTSQAQKMPVTARRLGSSTSVGKASKSPGHDCSPLTSSVVCQVTTQCSPAVNAVCERGHKDRTQRDRLLLVTMTTATD